MGEHHPERKQFVRNVRLEGEEKAKNKRPAMRAESDSKPEVTIVLPPLVYLPYKCGLCEEARETEEEVRRHCREAHELEARYKCAQCQEAGEDRKSIEDHALKEHGSSSVLRAFFVEQCRAVDVPLTKREPLWRRDMPGMRHIRGILYEDDEGPEIPAPVPAAASVATKAAPGGRKKKSKGKQKQGKLAARAPPPPPAAVDGGKEDGGMSKVVGGDPGDDSDSFPMKCKECKLPKKTIKALKMHIKLLHLRTGKFRWENIRLFFYFMFICAKFKYSFVISLL